MDERTQTNGRMVRVGMQNHGVRIQMQNIAELPDDDEAVLWNGADFHGTGVPETMRDLRVILVDKVSAPDVPAGGLHGIDEYVDWSA